MISDQRTMADLVIKGDQRSIARVLSKIEGANPDVDEILATLLPNTGRAHIIGITGVPGSGKSTLVSALTKAFRKTDKTVGILAIDPTSPFSQGAILGDRIRMSELSTDPGVFIRSLATRGALGGLARATEDMTDVLDAAGFDVVLIETVGVGQDEVDIASAAQTVVVVSAPGLGDDIQAIKAGVLEIADVHVISKSDKPDAFRTASDLRAMIKLGSSARENFGWEVPVILTSAETGQGIENLASSIGCHAAHLAQSPEGEVRKEQRIRHRLIRVVEDMLRRRLEENNQLNDAIQKTLSGQKTLRDAARSLLP